MKAKKKYLKHGLRKSPFYNIWYLIHARCNNVKNHKYPNYGGRGIKCLWRNFMEFRDDMYESYTEHVEKFGEKQTSIDRVDNDSHYCKENCRWATVLEQGRNKRNNRILTLGKESKCVSEWSEQIGVGSSLIRARIDRLGWSVEDALTKASKSR